MENSDIKLIFFPDLTTKAISYRIELGDFKKTKAIKTRIETGAVSNLGSRFYGTN